MLFTSSFQKGLDIVQHMKQRNKSAQDSEQETRDEKQHVIWKKYIDKVNSVSPVVMRWTKVTVRWLDVE